MKKAEILKGLNQQQVECVTTIDGPCQCLAVAGAGKTTALTKRIAYMIESGINPSSIMVATFTKKAAEEMIERLSLLINKNQLKSLTIGTFHSIGYKILKREYTLMNNPLKGMSLINGDPQIWLMDEIVKDLNINKFSDDLSSIILAEINKYKLSLINPQGLLMMATLDTESTTFDIDVAKCYVEYEKRKTKNKQIDFNDMIFQLYNLFVEYPTILEKYQSIYDYILVDETQDCNKSQYTLVQMLAYPQNNIFVVGDDDQSVYGFRGAQPQNFIDFKEAYNAKIINMETNYRSLPYILETANKLIANNKVRIDKKLIPFQNGDKNKKVPYSNFENEDEEGEFIADKINNLNSNKINFSDMYVIYRTNAQSRAIEDACIKHGIPYLISGSISFYDRAEIKDILAYIRLAVDSNDDEALLRIINKPSRFLGKAFIEGAKKIAKTKFKMSLFEAISYVNVNSSQKNNVKKFKDIIIQINKLLKGNRSTLIMDIVKLVKYDEYLMKDGKDEEDNIRMENLKSLQVVLDRYKTIKEFIDYANSIKQLKEDGSNCVKLMTIHKSKGLESKVVFMIGMNDGLLPHKRAYEDGNIEEERRLTYVGITRAKEKLFLTSTSSFQKNMYLKSTFLHEMGVKTSY